MDIVNKIRIMMTLMKYDDAQADNIFQGKESVTVEVVNKINICDSFLDKRMDITLLENFCSEEAYEKFAQKINIRRRRQESKCGSCNHNLKSNSVQCEECLIWHHFKCCNYSNHAN